MCRTHAHLDPAPGLGTPPVSRPQRCDPPPPAAAATDFKELSALEQSIHFFHIRSGSAAFSVPQPADNVSVWNARDHAVWVPWPTLRVALVDALGVNGSREHYSALLRRRSGVTYESECGAVCKQLRQEGALPSVET